MVPVLSSVFSATLGPLNIPPGSLAWLCLRSGGASFWAISILFHHCYSTGYGDVKSFSKLLAFG